MRLQLDPRARALLRRLPVTNAYSVLELLLIAGLAVQGARLIWTIATPVDPLGAWRPVEPVVPSSPAALLRDFDPFFRITGVAAGPAVVTTLQLQLFGTRIDEAMGRSSAIIAGPDNIQMSVVVGSEIQPGVRLKAVAFDHVTIARGGVDEDLFLDQSSSVQPVAGAAPTVAGAAPPPSSGGAPVTVDRLRADIGFIPRLDGGRVSGLVVRAQGSGAAFREAGLRDGDILTAIGGRPVSGPGDVDRVAADFAGGGNIPITVERGGQTLPLTIAVTPR